MSIFTSPPGRPQDWVIVWGIKKSSGCAVSSWIRLPREFVEEHREKDLHGAPAGLLGCQIGRDPFDLLADLTRTLGDVAERPLAAHPRAG